MNHLMLASSKIPEVTAEGLGNAGKALALTAITLILLYVCVKSLISHGTGGDYNQSFKVIASVLIILSLIPIGAGVATVSGYGGAVLDLILSLVSFGQK